ncbi:MAG TPA: tRNA pseudouridine(55) synthase TruB [Pirellulales bacterium]|nr:tRNA pseudouridine(55) synthase TruB [Pirellulales bacterium]
MTDKKPFGIVNLHKPPGMTSREAVDCVKRLVRAAKTGHAGTLDPLATGVLVVCVGPATRLIEYVQAMPKGYRAAFLLGQESDTEDVEGQVRLMADARQPTEAEVREAAARLVGVIEQRPPAYSALKVRGRRAYDLARAGKAVELAPRPVVVHRLEVVTYDYPELRLDIECGSGTYVRSLGRDLAQSLGTAAVMSELVRTAIGCFTLADAKLPEQLLRDRQADWLQSPLRALSALPKTRLSAGQIERLHHGQTIHGPAPSEGEMAAVDEHEELVAIVSAQPDGTLRPVQNFAGS